jgi:stage II sporulation protein AA (anti-sigma F factor antagonist)
MQLRARSPTLGAIHCSSQRTRADSEGQRVTAHAVDIEIHSRAACVVTLRGEHDPSTIRELATAMNLATAYQYVLVDLSECTFLDSSAINTLLQAAELASERGGALELVADVGRHDAVRRALEIMGIDGLLLIHATRTAGLISLEGGKSPRPVQKSPPGAGNRTQTFGARIADAPPSASTASHGPDNLEKSEPG